MPRHAALPVVAALTVAALGLAACSGDKPAAAPTSTTPTTTTAATTTPAPTPSGPVPLTGGPVLAVKIDNTPAARPRIGLDRADVVYVEPVEGGLTRLLAVFSRTQAPEVGPVRSGRESDVDLVANYGKVALAFSGSSSYTKRILDRGKQVNLSFDQNSRGYHRDRSRPAPYNVIGNPKQLLARAGGSVEPADIGFRYGDAPAGGKAATSVAARWPSSRVSLAWSAKRKAYLITTDGRAEVSPGGKQYTAGTVVVQYVATHQSGNRDKNGQPTPVVDVVGKGKAVVLRDGKVWTGAWSRKGVTAPTAFTVGGEPLTFDPEGAVWVLLVAPGQSVTVR
ncbi:DUF3048 domain-containing protein [Pedococcus dokdonensis]|uniref:DUF3048 domain-containing protein n=1 Tax=Pedococcus dokdonensis TaxID=443156 RepID=UPI0012FDB83A|nr:DUF3048 domain-containing protein [Pedococcus dokdonensis]